MDPMGMFFVDLLKLNLEVRQAEKGDGGAFRMGFGHILDHWNEDEHFIANICQFTRQTLNFRKHAHVDHTVYICLL
jgi:desulfoferrodoxin (superoxide reductase-like protein)